MEGNQSGKGQLYLIGGEIVNGIFDNNNLVHVLPSINEAEGSSFINRNNEFSQTSQRSAVLKTKKYSLPKKLSKIDEFGNAKSSKKM